MLPNLVAHYFDGTGGASHIVRDVSSGGAFVYANFQWPPGTIVKLTLELTRTDSNGRPPTPVVLQSKVVRCTPRGLGVQFLLVKKAERETLTHFLKDIPESIVKHSQDANREQSKLKKGGSTHIPSELKDRRRRSSSA